MMRREAILRSASVAYFKRKIEAGLTSADDFLMIECGTANIIVKEMYDGDILKWLHIVDNMGVANPSIFNYMIENRSQFINDYEKTI
jgi:isopropylmalate/homocitrate/citramalate synthase